MRVVNITAPVWRFFFFSCFSVTIIPIWVVSAGCYWAVKRMCCCHCSVLCGSSKLPLPLRAQATFKESHPMAPPSSVSACVKCTCSASGMWFFSFIGHTSPIWCLTSCLVLSCLLFSWTQTWLRFVPVCASGNVFVFCLEYTPADMDCVFRGHTKRFMQPQNWMSDGMFHSTCQNRTRCSGIKLLSQYNQRNRATAFDQTTQESAETLTHDGNL